MKKNSPSFVFFGSGPVAAESLRQLSEYFQIEAVITKATTQKEMNDAAPNTPIHLVSDKRTLDELLSKQQFHSKLGVLIDFGIIVSNNVIDYFPYGIVNSHFSLLPLLRGADPISFAVLEGHKHTGVSLMLLVEAMDEGPLLATKSLSITDMETTPTLTKKLIQLSTQLLVETLPKYLENELTPYQQITNETIKPTYTRKLKKDDGVIDWSKPAKVIEREIRAFQGWPKSRTFLGAIEVIILKANVATAINDTESPGTIHVIDSEIFVTCGTDCLRIDELQPAGKRSMQASAFLAGYKNRLQ